MRLINNELSWHMGAGTQLRRRIEASVKTAAAVACNILAEQQGPVT